MSAEPIYVQTSATPAIIQPVPGPIKSASLSHEPIPVVQTTEEPATLVTVQTLQPVASFQGENTANGSRSVSISSQHTSYPITLSKTYIHKMTRHWSRSTLVSCSNCGHTGQSIVHKRIGLKWYPFFFALAIESFICCTLLVVIVTFFFIGPFCLLFFLCDWCKDSYQFYLAGSYL